MLMLLLANDLVALNSVSHFKNGQKWTLSSHLPTFQKFIVDYLTENVSSSRLAAQLVQISSTIRIELLFHQISFLINLSPQKS